MRSRYRKTFAGFLWVIANPIINFCVQALVFQAVLKVNITHYPVFLVSGLMPWFFISQSVTSHASCLVNARELLLGFKLNPLTVVCSQVLDNFVNFLCSTFIVMLGILLVNHLSLSFLQLFIFFLNSLLLFGFVFLLTTIVSIFHVFYRDVQFVCSFLMNITFFTTPIFYLPESIPHEFQWIFKINFFYPFIRIFQSSLYELNLNSWGESFIISLGVVTLMGALVWISLKNKMKDFYINV